MFQLVVAAGQIISNAGELKRMLWWQWLMFVGGMMSAFGGAYESLHHQIWLAIAAALVVGGSFLKTLHTDTPFGQKAAQTAAQQSAAKLDAPGKQSNDDIFGTHAIIVFFLVAAAALTMLACSPALISVKGGEPLTSASGTGFQPVCPAPTAFAFATPLPAPQLPLVKGDECPGYSLCLDEKNRGALFGGINVLENDGTYMRDFYKGQIKAYRESVMSPMTGDPR